MDFSILSTGTLYYASRISFQIGRTFMLLSSRKRDTRQYEGYYCGLIYHGLKKELHIADVVRIKASWSRIAAEPVWKHNNKNNYSMYLKIHRTFRDFVYGYWQHNQKLQRFGTFVFRRQDNDGANRLVGTYIGVSTKRTIQNSTWILERVDDNRPFTYFSWRNYFKRRNVLLKKRELLKSIIEKHRGYFASTTCRPFRFNNLSFEIPTNGFNPEFGKISVPLLEKTIEDVGSFAGKSVLDVGCGSGFYAVALAQQNAKHCLGIDITQDMINVAKNNARRNTLSQRCDFRVSEQESIFSCLAIKEKYDVIIANLPFTNRIIGKHYKDDPFAANFVSSDKMLFDFLMGVRMHLAASGRLYMSYGKSGYMDALAVFCELAGLTVEEVDRKEEKDEMFFTYKIQHKSAKFMPLDIEDLSIAPAITDTIEPVS